MIVTLKEYRKRGNLRQLDIANAVGVDRSSVAKWERGLTVPSVSKIAKIAKVLNVTESDIVKAVLEPNID